MNTTNFITALKEFFLDIIGYLIPGLIFTFCIYHFAHIIGKTEVFDSLIGKDFQVFYIIISYVLGYVLYGLGLLFDFLKYQLRINSFRDFLSKKPKLKGFLNKLPVDILEEYSDDFDLARIKTELSKLYGISESQDYFKSAGVLSLRSKVMSYIPEFDSKIYLFMFRSELCNLTAVALKAYYIFIFGFFVQGFFVCEFMERLNNLYPIVMILYVLSYLLYKARSRFYSIAIKIPFSIFLTKRISLS